MYIAVFLLQFYYAQIGFIVLVRYLANGAKLPCFKLNQKVFTPTDFPTFSRFSKIDNFL